MNTYIRMHASILIMFFGVISYITDVYLVTLSVETR